MDRRLFFLFNMAQKKLFRHIDKVCEEQLDATITQLAALMLVCQQPGCLQKELASALDLNKSAVTGLVSRMETNGLLERRGGEDARAVCLYATAAGEDKVQQVKPIIQQLNQRFSDEFSDDEINTILRFLNFILQSF